MIDDARTMSLSPALVSTATVVDVGPRGLSLRSAELGERVARNAVAGGYRPRRGDEVVVIADGRGECFVVGVLRALREAEEPAPELPSELTVERADGCTRIVIAEGDLELAAPTGRVRIAGAEGVSIGSERDVEVRARRAVTIESHDGERARSGLRLDGDAAELSAGVLAARAARLAVLAEEVTAFATRLDARIDDVRQQATRIEVRAVELIEHARDSYREIEGLSQTRAGRIRLVAASTLSALAERAKLKARTVFAIDGESIHLG